MYVLFFWSIVYTFVSFWALYTGDKESFRFLITLGMVFLTGYTVIKEVKK